VISWISIVDLKVEVEIVPLKPKFHHSSLGYIYIFFIFVSIAHGDARRQDRKRAMIIAAHLKKLRHQQDVKSGSNLEQSTAERKRKPREVEDIPRRSFQ
jgi:hypothetical protein